MKTCIDFDDYYDDTVVELGKLEELKREWPAFMVTLFAIPGRCSPSTVKRARDLDSKYGGGWLQLAPHGWQHSRFECLAWTDDELVDRVNMAVAKGIEAPVFRPPGWICDEQAYEGCKRLGYVMASHKDHRCNVLGVKEYVYNLAHTRGVAALHGHLTDTPYVDNYIHNMEWPDFSKAEFVWPQEVAW